MPISFKTDSAATFFAPTIFLSGNGIEILIAPGGVVKSSILLFNGVDNLDWVGVDKKERQEKDIVKGERWKTADMVEGENAGNGNPTEKGVEIENDEEQGGN